MSHLQLRVMSTMISTLWTIVRTLCGQTMFSPPPPRVNTFANFTFHTITCILFREVTLHTFKAKCAQTNPVERNSLKRLSVVIPDQTGAAESNHCVRSISETHQRTVCDIVSSHSIYISIPLLVTASVYSFITMVYPRSR